MQAETQGPPPVLRERESRPWLVAITTLLALLVVWFVIFDPVFKSAKISAASGREKSYVQAADLALFDYMDEHDGRYPNFSGDMVATLRPYIDDPKVIEAMQRFQWNDKLSGKKIREIEDTHSQWVLYSKAPGTQNYSVGFADGLAHHASSGYLALILRGKAKVL